MVRLYEDMRLLQTRLAIVQSVIVALVAGLALQFWSLQVLRGRYFRDLAENNRLRTVRLAAPRGNLLDRDGRVLVENRAAFNVVLTPEHSGDLPRTVDRLARLLHVDAADLKARVAGRDARFQPVIVKSDATLEDVAAVEARRSEQPEAAVAVVPLRSYPLAESAAQIFGRVGEVTDRQLKLPGFEAVEPGAIVGQAGLESLYNLDLMGQDGQRKIIVNSRGVEVKEEEVQAPREGPALTLGIDLDLQRALEQAMAGRAGSALALDPDTGEVLAILSHPAYDPNLFASGIDAAEWGRLNRDAQTPLLNRVIQGQYAPGSTFKIVMAVAGLAEGVITPQTRFSCPGQLAIYGTVFRCHKKGGHGSLNLREAIAQSCNVYFYNVGVKLEIDRIARYSRLLGLSAPTGIDLPGELSGLIPDPAWKRRTQNLPWYAGETVSVAIGQAMTVTPAQMARLAAAILTGKLVSPALVTAVAGKRRALPPPTDLPIPVRVLEEVRAGMRAVVEGGTGHRARVDGVEVGGKTGSAQVVTHARLEGDKDRPEFQPHGWFVSFASDGHRRIAMAVLVEHGTAGGTSAAPVTGQVYRSWFRRERAGAPGVEAAD